MTERPAAGATPGAAPEWGSDVIAAMLRELGVEYVALNPGASFRGLHDSLVNHLGNDRPEIVICNHEEVAVAIAHGYAKLLGRAMAVALHSNVGLMHASMGLFCAWADRQPVLALGGTGPMDSSKRRPWIDWVHTSNAQGELVRDYVKWDHQPGGVAAIPEAILRAWQVIHQEPRGPAYLSFDVSHQEERLTSALPLPDLSRYPHAAPLWPDPDMVRHAAQLLVGALHPVILPGRVPPTQQVWDDLQELAELLGAAVLADWKSPTSFTSTHDLQQNAETNFVDEDTATILAQADVILSLDRIDPAGTLRAGQAAPTAQLIHVSPDVFAVRAWSADHQELPPATVPLVASIAPTISALVVEVRAARSRDGSAAGRIADRATALRSRRRQIVARWAAERTAAWDRSPLSLARVLGELRLALGPRARDAILARATLNWPRAAWEFDRPAAYLGGDGGGGIGSGPGMAVGTALAARGSGRPVIAVLGDGDLLMAPTALWTAAHHDIPLLVVVANNQTYLNDEEHQERVAIARGRPVANRWIGQRMDRPAVDFARLASSMGVESFGPIAESTDLAPAFAGALRVLDEGRPVLVDARISR
ncbi:MAG TPA: thiamine pyrophosphate-binding protein [Candidatus Limnocylindria bacterium]|nr:thiamine pyrophosphate-binding protein [Candidatus Limnocylindria bacterium]